MAINAELIVKPYRKKFAIFAGSARLSQGYLSESDAQGELDNNESLYRYWAGSAGVSIENTPAKIIKLV